MSAAVADVIPPADRARAYGLVYWAVNLALSVGLVIGGLVAERSFVALFLADAGTSIAAAAIVLFCVPETRPVTRVIGCSEAACLEPAGRCALVPDHVPRTRRPGVRACLKISSAKS